MNQNLTTQFKQTSPSADIEPGSVDRPEGGTHGWAGMKFEDNAAGFDQELQGPAAELCATQELEPRDRHRSAEPKLPGLRKRLICCLRARGPVTLARPCAPGPPGN